MTVTVARQGSSLCIALGLIWPGHAIGKAEMLVSLADLSLEELSSIEVTSASKHPQALSDAPTAIFVITADDIRRSGASSLPEALRLAPNLHVAKVSNTGYSITARGFSGKSANKLLVLIDGRSVYTPLFAGVFWDIQDVMLQDVERIEVISGPGGTLWGVNAVNGVINVITRSALDTQDSLVGLRAGTDGADIAVRQGSAWGTDGGLRVYAKHFNRNHTERANGTNIDDTWQMSEVGFRADREDGRDNVMVQGQLHRGNHGQPSPGSIVITGVPMTLHNIDTQGGNLLGRWVRKLDQGSEVHVEAYADVTERQVPPTFNEKLDIVDLQLQYTPPPSETQTWTFGGQYRRSHDRLDNSVYFGFLPEDVRQTWASLFAQDDITLHPDLHLTLGNRFEHNDYTGLEWLPNARLAWKAAPDHLLWTALSRTVRSPSRLDRDPYIPWPANFPPLGFRYLLAGGEQVKSEVARVLEIGYRGQPTANTSLSVNWYRSLYNKLHTQERGASPNYLVFAGRMHAAFSGLDIWGSYQPLPSWRLSAGFSVLYQRFQLEPNSTDTGNLLALRGGDPAQTWQVRSAWDLPHGNELDMTIRHVSALKRPDVPAYIVADVRWGWQPRPDLALSLTARNLFDSGHGEYTSIADRTDLSPSLSLQADLRF